MSVVSSVAHMLSESECESESDQEWCESVVSSVAHMLSESESESDQDWCESQVLLPCHDSVTTLS